MKLLKLLKPFLREQLGAATIALIAMVVYAITTALYAFISGPALKYLFSGEVDDILKQTDGKFRSVFRILPPEWLSRLESFSIQDGALFLPLIIVAIATIKGLAQAGQFYYMGEISQKLLKRLRSHSFANVVDQPMVFFTSRSQGDLISRLTNDVNQIEQAIFYGLGPMIREPLVLLGLLTYLFGSHTQLALLTFITIPIAAVPLVRFTTWLKSVSKRGQGAQAEMNRNMYLV